VGFYSLLTFVFFAGFSDAYSAARLALSSYCGMWFTILLMWHVHGLMRLWRTSCCQWTISLKTCF